MLLYVFLLVGGLCLGKEEEASQDKKENPLAHGFGNDIDWVKWEDVTAISEKTNRPIFMLIHKTWCGACKSLKSRMQTDPKLKDFVELSKKFVMVNLEDDEEPQDAKYAPDGGYIPRLFFLDKQGDLLSIDNKAKFPKNPHFYPELTQIIDGMNRALKEFGAAPKLVAPDGDEVEDITKKEDEKVEEKTKETPKEEKKPEKKEKSKDKEEKKGKKEKKEKEDKPKETKKDEVKKEKKEDEEPKQGTCPHAAKHKKEAEKKTKKDGEKKPEKKEKKEEKPKKEKDEKPKKKKAKEETKDEL